MKKNTNLLFAAVALSMLLALGLWALYPFYNSWRQEQPHYLEIEDAALRQELEQLLGCDSGITLEYSLRLLDAYRYPKSIPPLSISIYIPMREALPEQLIALVLPVANLIKSAAFEQAFNEQTSGMHLGGLDGWDSIVHIGVHIYLEGNTELYLHFSNLAGDHFDTSYLEWTFRYTCYSDAYVSSGYYVHILGGKLTYEQYY